MTPEDLEALQGRLRYLLYAERVTRILCRRSGEVPGFKWDGYSPGRTCRASAWHRAPPLPFHSFKHRGAGTCRVCGQPIYGGGSFRSFAGPVSPRLTWHSLCVASYTVMTKPAEFTAALVLRQDQKCGITGRPIELPYEPSGVDVDHEVPLFRVAREHGAEPWFDLIRFWGSGNLRAVIHAAHVAKSAAEAKERAGNRAPIVGQEALL